MKKYLTVGAIVILFAATVSVVAAAGSESLPPKDEFLPARKDSAEGPPGIDGYYSTPSKVKIPTLTEKEKKKAKEIALNDPLVKSILDGKRYSDLLIGVWHEGSRKIGASVAIRFSDPIWVDAKLPYPNPDKSASYDDVVMREISEYAPLISISVDLTENRVVKIIAW